MNNKIWECVSLYVVCTGISVISLLESAGNSPLPILAVDLGHSGRIVALTTSCLVFMGPILGIIIIIWWIVDWILFACNEIDDGQGRLLIPW